MVRFRDCLKSLGTIIVCFCAAFLTFLFQEFRLDLLALDITDFNEYQKAYYDAQIIQSNIMLGIAVGILSLFAVVTLVFSIVRFINVNEGNMGILKALGYSRFEIALKFTKYGINTFIGCVLGYLGSLAFKNTFYNEMNKDPLFPNVKMHFHPLFILIVITAPTILFSAISFIVAYIKLNKDPLKMIKGTINLKSKQIKENDDFSSSLRKSILHSHISLILFVGFAALCFGATVQMSFSMDSLGASPLFFWMMFLIGLLLGCAILYLAFSFAYHCNKEYMTLLKAYGYSNKECINMLYGGYISVTIIGFVIGTIYQYGLMKLMIKVFSQTIEIIYNYNWLGLLYTLLIFVPIYVFIELLFFYKMKKQLIKDVIFER